MCIILNTLLRNMTQNKKIKSLKRERCLHPNPEQVQDERFLRDPFFDPNDLIQVKYEMLRRVSEKRDSVKSSTARFGLSRPVFYTARRAFQQGGLPALLPKPAGPRQPHKLTATIREAMQQHLRDAPGTSIKQLQRWIQQHHQVSVHRTTIERALRASKKKHR